VISSYAIYGDRVWHHVSFSLSDAVPSHEQTTWIKNVFVRSDLKSMQIYPIASEYVNLHRTCLHLWSCLEGDGLPDFRTLGLV